MSVMYMFIPVIFAMITLVMSPELLGQAESLQQGIAAPDQISLIKIKGDAGLTYVGTIIERNDKEIILLTEGKTKVHIPIETIQDIRSIPSSHFHDGEYWFPNPNETRYLYAPSAFNLKKGEGYYQNTYLFINSFNYGFTDNFSFGVGFEFLSTFGSFGGDFNPIFFLTPKYSMQVSENLRVGIGVLYGNVSDLVGGFGVGYGLATYGNPEHNATLGLGFGFFDGDFSTDPVITISGMTRISRRISLVTENWFFPADVYRGILTYGIRFFGESMSVDLALINNTDIATAFPIGIPYIDFVVKF